MDLDKKRLRKLQKLGLAQPVLAGSLNQIERTSATGRKTVYWLLTFKEAGKTRSVYVPKDLVKEVESWIRNYRRIKEQLAEISTLSIAIIRRHVPDKRCGRPGRRRKPPRETKQALGQAFVRLVHHLFPWWWDALDKFSDPRDGARYALRQRAAVKNLFFSRRTGCVNWGCLVVENFSSPAWNIGHDGDVDTVSDPEKLALFPDSSGQSTTEVYERP